MMNDVLPFIDMYRERGEQLGIATVVKTYGSAPRQVGAKMVVSASGAVAGSVSGGCVEGAVFETLHDVMQSGVPQLLHFGVADEQAWEVGLACGGEIDVFCERLDW
jgi:xanthine/CO dehydrogenase XdhC/CoxF family maturation factor